MGHIRLEDFSHDAHQGVVNSDPLLAKKLGVYSVLLYSPRKKSIQTKTTADLTLKNIGLEEDALHYLRNL